MPIRPLVSYSIERVEVLSPEGVVDDSLMPGLAPEQISRLYEYMVLTRQFDDRMFKLQRQGRLGTFARVAGQEGAHVGAAFALRPDDWLVPAFRETGALILRGLPLVQLLQYWGGDERGAAFPQELRTLPVAIPVGTHMLHAVGIAWAMKQAGEQAAVLTSFGEGATSEGDFSEAMNMAAVFKVPVVFFCQNNQYAISVPYTKQTASPTVAQKALAYGMFGVQVDGNDVFAVYRVAMEALERARTGHEPTLIEALTYRVMDHTTSDDAQRYRSEEEVEPWRQRDPIERLGRYMRTKGLLDDVGAADVLARADQKVADAVAAFEAIVPPGPEEIFNHVFAEMTPQLVEQQAELMARLARRR
ncbi:MAG: pyruvate dehydrogenase (acetyl-transferring) E1 component subunit alpha [Actinobacteria bacterium RBG_16_64_13]|nr:MAG: pyruvate dehydrogenase (acetyl-transferring) E1 component subunit alpha [Actinobacteria bacterium RBG_16_64_13]